MPILISELTETHAEATAGSVRLHDMVRFAIVLAAVRGPSVEADPQALT